MGQISWQVVRKGTSTIVLPDSEPRVNLLPCSSVSGKESRAELRGLSSVVPVVSICELPGEVALAEQAAKPRRQTAKKPVPIARRAPWVR
jgi:hypothetical protein